MFKFTICFLATVLILPAYADFTTYSGHSGNSFNSKLRMNQPKTTVIGHTGSRRHNRISPHKSSCYRRYNPFFSKNDLDALEKYSLNKTYKRENDIRRLERLEDLAFGATQTGDLYSRYKNVENAILSRPQYKTKSSLLNNVANYFAGQATGFTPNLLPYPDYNSLGGFTARPYAYMPTPGYSNNNIEQYSNGIFGGGWGFSGSNYGTGSSVRILD